MHRAATASVMAKVTNPDLIAERRKPGGRQPGAGRPPLWNKEIAETILLRVALGESIAQICRDEDMPDRETVRRHVIQDREYAAAIARARIEQADSMDEYIVDVMEKVETGELSPEQGRVLIWGAQWRAKHLNATRYGDKSQVAVEHSGTVRVLTEERRKELMERRKVALFGES